MRRPVLAGTLCGIAIGALAAPALAQDGDGCGAFKWPIATERQLLAAPDLPTIASGEAFPALGHGATVTLMPEADVPYTVKPARPPKVNPAYGAEVALADATQGAAIQVTLSAEAWVDVVQGGKVLRSSAFSGKTGCPGIRKSVRFSLAPGPAKVAISDSADPAIRMAIVPAP